MTSESNATDIELSVSFPFGTGNAGNEHEINAFLADSPEAAPEMRRARGLGEEPFVLSVVRDHHMQTPTADKGVGCDARFARQDDLPRDWQTHENPMRCTSPFGGTVYARHASEPSHGDEQYQYTQSSAQLPMQYDIGTHMREHHPRSQSERVDPDQGCVETFTRPDSFAAHTPTHDDPHGPFECPIYGESLSEKDELTTHMELHSSKRSRHPSGPYQCQICGKCLSRNDKLKRHMKVHESGRRTKLRTTTIDGEDQNFSIRPTVTRVQACPEGIESHAARGVGKRRPFQCSMCLKSFTEKHHLKRHMVSSVHAKHRFNLPEPLAQPTTYVPEPPISTYTQECIGCGEDFTDEQTFYTHAPCYGQAGMNHERRAIERSKNGDSEDEEDHEGQVTTLADFEAQLLAAAASDMSGNSGNVNHLSTRAMDTVELGSLTGSTRRLLGAQELQQPQVKTKTQHITALGAQWPRSCFGCNKVIFDKKSFWSHSPCFATTTKTERTPAVMADVSCYAEPGEDLDWTKATNLHDPTSHRRLERLAMMQ